MSITDKIDKYLGEDALTSLQLQKIQATKRLDDLRRAVNGTDDPVKKAAAKVAFAKQHAVVAGLAEKYKEAKVAAGGKDDYED